MALSKKEPNKPWEFQSVDNYFRSQKLLENLYGLRSAAK